MVASAAAFISTALLSFPCFFVCVGCTNFDLPDTDTVRLKVVLIYYITDPTAFL